IVFVLDEAAKPSATIVEAYLDDPPGWIVVICDDAERLPTSLRNRLEPVRLHLPGLAQRQGDVEALAPAVLATLAARAGRPEPAPAPDAVAALSGHQWPAGRVELEAVLSRAFLLASVDGAIEARHLELASVSAPRAAATSLVATPDAPGPRLEYLLAELAHEL